MNRSVFSHRLPNAPVFDEAVTIVCFSHLRWHFVTQRPQHLMTRAAKTNRVFFWEEPVWHGAEDAPERGRRWLETEQVEPCLWVVRPHLREGESPAEAQRELLRTLVAEYAIHDIIRWYYTPMALAFSSDLPSAVTVYDCMDELSGFIGAPPELSRCEQELFRRADLVFTGGLSLYEAKRRQHANVFAFPSSIDAAHFGTAKAGTLREPEELRGIPHPRVGFYGVIDERFDTQLLSEVARLRPEVQFIVLGPVVKIDPATLPDAPNIHRLGGKSYAELPSYLAHWDAAMMPFAMNEATRFISPTKTPEFLAAGKTVVSTPIRDVVRSYGREGLVQIAETAESFAEALDRALGPQTAAWRKAVAAALARSSWDSTWTDMWIEIKRVSAGHRAVPKPSNPELRSAQALYLRGFSRLPMAIPESAETAPLTGAGMILGTAEAVLEGGD